MKTAHFYALLGELCAHLIEETKLVGGVSRRRRRRELLSRAQAMLAAGDDSVAPSNLVEATRRVWERHRRVRIDDMAPCRIDRDGVWVGAWVLAAAEMNTDGEVDPELLATAIVGLSPLTRDVFTLYCRDGRDYPSIAAKLAISEEVVRRELAAALSALDQALYCHRGDDVSPIA